YSVPPIKMIFFSSETRTNTSELVPSTAGSALNVGADTIVNSGLIANASSFVSGRINIVLANMLCQLNSFTTCSLSCVCGSAPASPLKTNNSSLLSKYVVTLSNKLSKTSSEIGWFTSPQSTLSADTLSLTMKRSFGLRPVYSPVCARRAPVLVSTASPRLTDASTSSAFESCWCVDVLLTRSLIKLL